MNASPCLYGIGVGPGDPELMTLKAVRLLQAVDFVAYFAKAGRQSTARVIADQHVAATCEELPLFYPMTTEIAFTHPEYRARLAAFYEEATSQIATRLAAGRRGALLCEGDPLFYGSFMHVFERLKGSFQAEIVPGITGMAGAWSAAGLPMTWGDDVLTVIPATLPYDRLVDRLRDADAIVIMKLGKNISKVQQAIEKCGLMDRAVYVEYATRQAERILPLATLGARAAPYFALVLVAGRGRRP
ncbi:precorrin-2/cobalt-factor-2 C20-methyltransferase [Arboricoccus pini]|uniref:Precorrin-2/cobalt-factor-2 C20-methyltransferase n=1 Tax=Arboricoccus pini TaxID=1963835 RepID=A0A212RNY7_9PROT|nr:precorrin-2 C(20)-methyltransferase [Arboricoccus pini]SNB74103.1 precorrin-2/cobalt-factor-2 C20-methyltransferase [Arboricoccus pini]